MALELAVNNLLNGDLKHGWLALLANMIGYGYL
jgi:hypothetical protein